MSGVVVAVLHPEPDPGAGPFTRATAAARLAVAERHVARFLETGATEARVHAGPADDRSFGARLRDLVRDMGDGGLIVLGSGALPLATHADRRELVEVAGDDRPRALTNNRYSADVVAVAQARSVLARVPDLPSDNALPRWLEEEAGYRVDDLRRRWRLAIDLDSPLDVVLAGGSLPRDVDSSAVTGRIERLRVVAADRRAEVVIAGRTSATTLRWVERRTASRTRALVEERGLRAIGMPMATRPARPPRSTLGLVLDDRGPGALGGILAELGDAALVDSRVLLAHRLGADEAAWPSAEDRYASDLLLPDGVRDPWLRELTASARDSSIPILLGGHTLVGPGVRLLLRRP